jgi:hypothetical protein
MKKFLAVVALTLAAVPAMAQHHGYHGGYYYHHGHRGGWGGWVAPAIIGGVIGYEINRANQPVIVQQPPVVIQQPPVVYQQPMQSCTPWTETQNPDGTITRTRTCTQ